MERQKGLSLARSSLSHLMPSAATSCAEYPSSLPTFLPFRTKLTGFLWLGLALLWV